MGENESDAIVLSRFHSGLEDELKREIIRDVFTLCKLFRLFRT